MHWCGYYKSMPPFSVSSLMICLGHTSSNQLNNITCPWCQWSSSSSLSLNVFLDNAPFHFSQTAIVMPSFFIMCPKKRIFLKIMFSCSIKLVPILPSTHPTGLSFSLSIKFSSHILIIIMSLLSSHKSTYQKKVSAAQPYQETIYILGIPDMSLSGLNTRTALSDLIL